MKGRRLSSKNHLCLQPRTYIVQNRQERGRLSSNQTFFVNQRCLSSKNHLCLQQRTYIFQKSTRTRTSFVQSRPRTLFVSNRGRTSSKNRQERGHLSSQSNLFHEWELSSEIIFNYPRLRLTTRRCRRIRFYGLVY